MRELIAFRFSKGHLPWRSCTLTVRQNDMLQRISTVSFTTKDSPRNIRENSDVVLLIIIHLFRRDTFLNKLTHCIAGVCSQKWMYFTAADMETIPISAKKAQNSCIKRCWSKTAGNRASTAFGYQYCAPKLFFRCSYVKNSKCPFLRRRTNDCRCTNGWLRVWKLTLKCFQEPVTDVWSIPLYRWQLEAKKWAKRSHAEFKCFHERFLPLPHSNKTVARINLHPCTSEKALLREGRVQPWDLNS